MSQPFIVQGDKTDHGGAVSAGSPFTDIDGKPVARQDDRVSCPKCGPTTIAIGDPTCIIDGKPVARHGDKTACGATLISGQVRVLIDAGGGGGSAAGSRSGTADATGTGTASPSSTATNNESVTSATTAGRGADQSAMQYDEQIQFVNVNGARLAKVNYRIELENGQTAQGVTDEEGRTVRIATAQPVRLLRAELSATNASCCTLHAEQAGAAPITVSMQAAATNPASVGTSVQVIETPDGEARGLTQGEIAIARMVFADAVDYSRVKVHKGEYLWFGLQPDDTAMTPNGEMYFNPEYFKEDFSGPDLRSEWWFIHEMAHVWQHQLGYPVKERGAIRVGLPYNYTLDTGKRLGDYNMEAQGNILADYYLLKFKGAPAFVSEKKYASPNALSLYEVVLSEFLKDPADVDNLP